MKVRVGFGLGGVAGASLDRAAFLGIVDACERGGWDSIWFTERVTSRTLDPVVAMAATAARTERLKFGPAVMVLPGRNPVLLAKELAAIDALSGGRMVAAFGLGVAVGSEHQAFAVDRGEAAARADEAVVLMRRLWTEERVTFDGRFFTVRDVGIGPRPAEPIDVWFGGHSDAAARRVGRLGDGWLPSFVTPEEYKAKADLARETAAAAGREIDPEHFGALVGYVPPEPAADPAPVLQALAARRPDVRPDDLAVAGDAALCARLEAFVEQGASKFVVLPLVPPAEWGAELARLRASVAAPVERALTTA